MDATYERTCMAIANKKYWSEFHHIINNYNDNNDTPLSIVKIREAISKIIPEEQFIAKSDKVTVDTFTDSPIKN